MLFRSLNEGVGLLGGRVDRAMRRRNGREYGAVGSVAYNDHCSEVALQAYPSMGLGAGKTVPSATAPARRGYLTLERPWYYSKLSLGTGNCILIESEARHKRPLATRPTGETP